MKKISFLVGLIFIISGNIFSQSTYSGNLSIADDLFFADYKSTDYYIGGGNAFPIGTFVNIKLPYSDDSINVKIVRRIPEDGIFVLIEKRAGEKLDLTIGDVLPVRIQVVDIVPPPLSALDEDEDLSPEPLLKGIVSETLNAESEVLDEEVIAPEDSEVLEEEVIAPEDSDILEEEVIAPEDSIILEEEVIAPEDSEVLEEEEVLTPEDSEVLEEEVIAPEDSVILEEEVLAPEDSVILEEEVIAPEDSVILEEEVVAPEDSEVLEEEVIAPEDSEVLEEEVIAPEDSEVLEEEVLAPEDSEILEEEVLTPEDSVILEDSSVIEPELEIFEDTVPGESMFDEKVTIGNGLSEIPETDTLESETDVKKIKRIFFLEPAGNKPPEGGTPDEDLIRVTTVDKSRSLHDGYYLQVGMYETTEVIEKHKEALSKLNFPYITVKEDFPTSRVRLLVGPVANDELGVIMLNLKNRGFSDFFRYKKK